MSRYEAVIGLEVHAQLRTKSKIFCSCSTAFGADPNENVCAVCSGMPGVLPVLNEKVVEYAAKMGLAVGCRVNATSVFARKNYFYPDLPKGYQISQFETPICEHGRLAVTVDGAEKVVGITRIHMEEDAGKNIHSATENASYVDLNRTGVPLIEIVSEPDMRSAEEAVAYLKALRSILVYLGICDGNMEEGSFRCDANVSLRPFGQAELGTRAELKNMNSFRHVQKAIEYEIERQADMLDDGQAVIQETRLYNVDKGVTASMRGKEEAHDYRYFPDPDLVPLVVTEAQLAAWAGELPELPVARRDRFVSQYGLTPKDADVLTAERDVADYFEEAARLCNEPKKAANWIMSELLRELNQAAVTAAACPLPAAYLASLVTLVESGRISGKIGKQIFPEIFARGLDPKTYVDQQGLSQISDSSALESAVDKILADNPDEVAAYKAGKTKLMGFFVGQIMKATKGQANPALVNELLGKKLA
ncbi:Asp-tRNA(Asn)/Glu-tRNA(Gln) amidotransferase subunit GatB [Desulfovibrio sulfodismutans]|uniref:Aspartyl/glutamyl-tRNA(Asn/Gln) amidotransferase subunit B n=1 Tax=Desulfolutivibrio sulfodismutans TaxID=63561 RepID=A0A7K3NMT5_9BACT|nr:Asp-tRNA(Asn)/Glu-tRNA(Gln) amidotransferase subunit GatB [Desulfolutivibrio sulfodismutans]NDY57488.1 Asp-tRNA(Asn)/Glu-tRNA(Gln) amidotransferase subunit GatB [Desulfolutivibrio sulfodismutans]QLA14297.1 Asp-tRNA(Asn)/Glu-tRNA(Gln) amidotransferase subunit GatB [Desulfolutivibrio sulfodismutans DSM 3696]